MKKWLLFISIFFLTACAQNNDVGFDNQNNRNGAVHPEKVNVRNTTNKDVDRESGQKIARHLEKLATSIPNVRGATAVVIGNYAVVGINVDANTERSQVGTIKYSVAESLKEDPHGAMAVVVADPDVNARLKEIQNDIQNGQPIQGITNELADIVGRLMPEIPKNLVEPQNPDRAPDKQKKEMSPKEEKQLEKEQQDQSNQYKD
ncbi:YhcN/YlaJ family sporulation lipoprotein [Oikeobacillus pervagus]|uniref:YhcN/YlaJ family sporulation lipoprotein n=1 Tax=Oikeobacillus pervagus TaxID=1325931 RepID=A0AAJ1WGL0_9BACI|nr:YhcN/YlaJ family sporulation lipoprotein [Oikeobacillus pervagus]MDQ0215192.1 YhcN/YlaJ family sporulation lipoprotein [Oikeobacillus pervagus]